MAILDKYLYQVSRRIHHELTQFFAVDFSASYIIACWAGCSPCKYFHPISKRNCSRTEEIHVLSSLARQEAPVFVTLFSRALKISPTISEPNYKAKKGLVPKSLHV